MPFSDLIRAPTWPDIAAGRFASAIRRDGTEGCHVAIIGLPDDTGIALNNGRIGAAHGPAAFRAAIARYGTAWDAHRRRAIDVRVADLGDVIPATPADFGGDATRAMHETHARITSALLGIHRAGLVPACIGGGHDLTFPAVRAAAQHTGAAVGGINVDPHLDVRDTPGSGMPFRSLIDGNHLDPKRFVEYGTARFANAREHVEWAAGRGATIATMDALREGHWPARAAFGMAFPDRGSQGFVSIDMDSVDGSVAPGVSAVNPDGFDVRTVCSIAERAGAHAGVRHFDIMELSPPHDESGRTARIAALIFLSFLTGFAERSA